MRVLVCGGRDYRDEVRVFKELDQIKPSDLIEGGASGADTLAYRWAKRNLDADHRHTYDADWDRHGKAAGAIRNQRMLDEGKPDLVLAFPGGRGTADMVRRAKRAGVKVVEIEP